MGIGSALQSLVSAEAAGISIALVIIFGIRYVFTKKTGELIGALVSLGLSLTFIGAPTVIINFLTGIVKMLLAGGGGV